MLAAAQGTGTGRLLERRLDTWIQSEMRRFHRGISATLLVLASVFLLAEAARYPQPRDRNTLLVLLLAVGVALFKLVGSTSQREQILADRRSLNG